MKKTFAIVLVLLALVSAAAAQSLVTITASNFRNSHGVLLASGQISFQPADSDGNAIGYQIGGTGQVIKTPVTCTIVNGAITGTCQIADTALTNPANVCFKTTVKNGLGILVLGPTGVPNTPKTGYECAQPRASSYWCTAGVCNFDNYVPTGISTALVTPGPAGPAGAAGPTGPAGTASVNSGMDIAKTAAPANPASGHVAQWCDSTTGFCEFKDPAGANVGPTGRPQDKAFYNMVADCGVDPSGVTSVHTAANACFTAHPKGHFKWPDGTYKVSGTMLPKGDGTWIECQQGGVFTSAAHFVSDAGVTVFDLDAANTTATKITGCYATGAEPWSNSTSANFILPLGWGGSSDADFIRVHTHGVVITDNLIEKYGRHGINVDSANYTGNANGFLIVHNRMLNNRGMGIHLQGVDSNAGKTVANDCAVNQLGCVIDDSFLGNGHDNDQGELNGVDQTTPGATKTITNSAITNNYATVTMTAHGFVVGDNLFCTGTTGGRLDGRWQVLDAVDANNVKVWSYGGDRASAADAGTCAKMPGSSGVWKIGLTGCTLNNGSATMTCTGGGYSTNVTGYPVNIPGAGAGGSNLVTWITPNGTAPNTFSLRNAASTTVTSINTVQIIVYPVPFKGIGTSQLQAKWDNVYSEGGQNPSQFGNTNRVDHGDQGAGVDTSWGSCWTRGDQTGGLHISCPGGILIDNNNSGQATQNVGFTFRPGQIGGTNGSGLLIWQKASDSSELFRLSGGVNSFGITESQSNPGVARTVFGWAPTATFVYTNGGNAVRLGSDTGAATVEHRSSNVADWKIGTTGLNTMYGGVNTVGMGVPPIYGSISLTAQTASVGATSAYAAAPVGHYRVCWNSRISTAATTSSSLLVTIGWNNGTAKTKASTAVTTNTVGDEDSACMTVFSAAAQNITYATTYSSTGATAMQYALRVTVEQLQ